MGSTHRVDRRLGTHRLVPHGIIDALEAGHFVAVVLQDETDDVLAVCDLRFWGVAGTTEGQHGEVAAHSWVVTGLVRFIRSVAVLALPAEGQVQWLNSLGLPGTAAIADEVAQEFDDGFLLLPQFVEQGWIPDAAVSKLRELDSLLADMSGPEKAVLWDVSALGDADEWAKVRKLATRILLDL